MFLSRMYLTAVTRPLLSNTGWYGVTLASVR